MCCWLSFQAGEWCEPITLRPPNEATSSTPVQYWQHHPEKLIFQSCDYEAYVSFNTYPCLLKKRHPVSLVKLKYYLNDHSYNPGDGTVSLGWSEPIKVFLPKQSEMPFHRDLMIERQETTEREHLRWEEKRKWQLGQKVSWVWVSDLLCFLASEVWTASVQGH